MVSIRTLIITDIGTISETPEEECKLIAWEFEASGIHLEHRHTHNISDIRNTWHEMVIVDYGGAMTGYGTPPSFRELFNWAENHPGKLLIVYTFFTAMFWQHEFEEEQTPRNVLFFDPIDKHQRTMRIDNMLKRRDGLMETVKQYYKA